MTTSNFRSSAISASALISSSGTSNLSMAALGPRCAYFFDAQLDFTTPKGVSKWEELVRVVAGRGFGCVLVNSMDTPQYVQHRGGRIDASTGRRVQFHPVDRQGSIGYMSKYANADQLHFAVEAPLLVTRMHTTWTDFALRKRLLLRRPSVIMSLRFGLPSGSRTIRARWQPELSPALKQVYGQSALRPHLYCPGDDDHGSGACDTCMFARGVCLEADVYRIEDWDRAKCRSFRAVGPRCLHVDARDGSAWRACHGVRKGLSELGV